MARGAVKTQTEHHCRYQCGHKPFAGEGEALSGLTKLYAYGKRAPSAKDFPDRWLYEMSLDLQKTPDEIRVMNIRDRNWLLLVKTARVKANSQVKQDF